MSDEATRAIDPRFDPRFQRGYVPDVAGGARAKVRREPTDAPTEVETELFGPRSAVTSDRRPAPLTAAPPKPEADHAAALLAYFAPEEPTVPNPPTEPGPRSDPAPNPPTDLGPASGGITSHSESGMRREVDDGFVEPEPESESPFVRHRWLGFWVALAASIAFVVGGAVLYWNVSLEQMSPSGRIAGAAETQAFLSALYALGIGLVQAGALGIVVVLALGAVMSARRGRV
ncbi:hypothetical protein [Agromyces aureus]|uniref:Uncharacterized protein n=1 Tax=Agromyces aureus TaxID=453304 RepID=A0A191WBH8_9MICO|nr:hypothetical protein [Agromyces aureus]ANJ25611.1 hypothetical protein ATC03_01345 [Agromyces aureus]